MIRIDFTPEQLEELNSASKDEIHADKIKRKILCLKMHHKGVKNHIIASVLNLTPNTITNYLKEYQEEGLAGTLEDKAYRPTSQIAPFYAKLIEYFEEHPPSDIAEATERITKLTGITLGETQTRQTLHKIGLKYRKTGVIPGNADPQLQLNFLDQELLPKLEEASKGERKVFFVDAAHFVLGSFLGMIWCLSRVFVKSGTGRRRYNVLGALDSHSKEVLSIRSEENISALSVCDLIDLIRKEHHTTPISLVMDNARYQRCKRVIQHAADNNVELLFLPAYSPNLNLIERLWKHLKKRTLKNRHFENFKSFREAIDNYLDNLHSLHQKELDSLLTLKFQTFS